MCDYITVKHEENSPWLGGRSDMIFGCARIIFFFIFSCDWKLVPGVKTVTCVSTPGWELVCTPGKFVIMCCQNIVSPTSITIIFPGHHNPNHNGPDESKFTSMSCETQPFDVSTISTTNPHQIVRFQTLRTTSIQFRKHSSDFSSRGGGRVSGEHVGPSQGYRASPEQKYRSYSRLQQVEKCKQVPFQMSSEKKKVFVVHVRVGGGKKTSCPS